MSEKEKITELCSREAEGTTTMLFSFEDVIQRRTPRPRRDVDLDRFSKAPRGSANTNVITGTGCFVLNFLCYGEPVQLLRKWFAVFCSTKFKETVAVIAV